MLYVFIGNRDQRLREAVEVALGRPDSTEVGFTRLDGAETSLEALEEACASRSLFGDRRRVFLDNAQALGGRQRRLFEWLAHFASQARGAPGEDPCHLAAAAYIDLGDRRQRDRARRFTKLGDAGAQVKEFRPFNRSDARRFVTQRAGTRGVRVTGEAADRLIELVTSDAGLLASEVDKLAAYAGFDGTIGVEDVDAASAAIGEHARWDYINAVSAHRLDTALAVLHDMLALNTPHQFVLSDIAASLRRLAQAKRALADGGGAAAVARATGMPTFRAQAMARQAAAISDRLLTRMFAEVTRTDRDLKSTGGDDAALLEVLTARLAARPTGQATERG